MSGGAGRRLLGIGLGVLLVVALPSLVPEYAVTLLNYIGLYTLVALGLVLLTGVAGQTSFGQAAFVAVIVELEYIGLKKSLSVAPLHA